ncbi:MAG: hypothetical protein ISS48_04540 [Candidatus Aenigmarchaeota archaeon]|nr:hypothetical protein [Candidatus Aenigmarchaeota archaeon]
MSLLQRIREKMKGFKERTSLKKIRKSITPEKPAKKGEELQFRIGATSGIYYVARAEEMAGIIQKLSYTLTRGAAVLELAGDVPHEVDYTQGKELRHISKAQGVDITFHGALTVPMCMPEMIEWNNAQQHIQKSVLSAVFCGAKYVNFHSCLKEWLELFTYASSRLHIIMSDCRGKFIGKMFYKNEKLAEWYVNDKKYRFWNSFAGVIVGPELNLELETAMDNRMTEIIKDNKQKIEEQHFGQFKNSVFRNPEIFGSIVNELAEKGMINKELVSRMRAGDTKAIQEVRDILTDELIKGTELFQQRFRDYLTDLQRLPYHSKIGELTRNQILGPETGERIRELMEKKREETIKRAVKEKLFDMGDWHEKERTGATLEMAYYIIAHDMFLNKKPDDMWNQMADLYNETLKNPLISYNENDEKWLEDLMINIETIPNKQLIHNFKEFYYGVVGAKFLQSHLEETVRWMEEEAPSIIDNIVERTEPDKTKVEEQKKILRKNLEDMIIAIENPDARGEHAGRFILWRPKQFLLAIRNAREALKDRGSSYWDKVLIIIDFEHLATQGVDPLKELEELKDHSLTKDLGKYVIGVHAGVPTPLHTHKPIKAVDREIIYRLLWKLKEVDLGSEHLTYLIFERGGFKRPYEGSVRALKAMAKQLKAGTKPEDLPERFFVISKPQYIARQKAIIFEHAFEPLKGVLKVPEEEYTLLGTGALKAGAKPEVWKKEELR